MNTIIMKYNLILFALTFLMGCNKNEDFQPRIEIEPNAGELITGQIQQALDSCGSSGGGLVYFPAGKYLTGGLKLRSNVTIQFEKGAILQGSDDYRDYGVGKRSDALLKGNDLKNITIRGEGLVDGVNCENPKGEAGFRGPHCIRLENCNNIIIQDIIIKRSANYAIYCRHSSNGEVRNVKIRGGHDGLHTRFCSNFVATGCDFRTGDDSFAGNDNRNFVIRNCQVNTSCNGFRLGCLNLTVENCKIWGPGEYKHIKQNRNNMLSAFVHFSPKDEDPELESGNWTIRDVTIDSVGNVYNYNYEDGLWQTGQPVTNVKFENITATRIQNPIVIKGDKNRKLIMIIKNSSFSKPQQIKDSLTFEGSTVNTPAFFNINNFDLLKLHDVTFKTSGHHPVLSAKNGNGLYLNNVKYLPESKANPFIFENVEKVNR